jgi:hypothetical protein
MILLCLFILPGGIRAGRADDESGGPIADREPQSRKQAVLRSLLMPGLGQHYREQYFKSFVFTVAAAGAGIFAYYNETARESAMKSYFTAETLYNNALSQAEMDAAFATMSAKYDEAEDKKRLRDSGLYLFAGIWALSILDAALGWSSPENDTGVRARVTADGSLAVAFTMRR